MGDETAQLLSLLLAGALGVAVLAAAWSRNRRSWRRHRADRDWLLSQGVDPGTERRDPVAWRLVVTADLGADGTFVRDVRENPFPTDRPAVRGVRGRARR